MMLLAQVFLSGMLLGMWSVVLLNRAVKRSFTAKRAATDGEG
jgi:hypothetical protein